MTSKGRKEPGTSTKTRLPLHRPLLPMDALLVQEIPGGNGWQYEPKWDGFRCLVFREGSRVDLQSKSGQPLTRYFPELVSAFANLAADPFVLDGEIAVPVNGSFSFDDLLQRIHPAQSRVQKLSHAHPAVFIAFDLLAGPDGKAFLEEPLRERRTKLEAFARKFFRGAGQIRLSPATTDVNLAKKWFATVGGDLD